MFVITCLLFSLGVSVSFVVGIILIFAKDDIGLKKRLIGIISGIVVACICGPLFFIPILYHPASNEMTLIDSGVCKRQLDCYGNPTILVSEMDLAKVGNSERFWICKMMIGDNWEGCGWSKQYVDRLIEGNKYGIYRKDFGYAVVYALICE